MRGATNSSFRPLVAADRVAAAHVEVVVGADVARVAGAEREAAAAIGTVEEGVPPQRAALEDGVDPIKDPLDFVGDVGVRLLSASPPARRSIAACRDESRRSAEDRAVAPARRPSSRPRPTRLSRTVATLHEYTCVTFTVAAELRSCRWCQNQHITAIAPRGLRPSTRRSTPVLRKKVKPVSELGSRQCDEAILVMKSAGDRFRQDVMAVSNPVRLSQRQILGSARRVNCWLVWVAMHVRSPRVTTRRLFLRHIQLTDGTRSV